MLILLLCLFSSLLFGFSNATVYRYVLTYDIGGDIVCHVSFSIDITNNGRGLDSRETVNWMFCAASGALHERNVHDVQSAHFPRIFATRNSDPGSSSTTTFTIGLNQGAIGGAPFTIQAAYPRVDMVVNNAGVPQWFCNYRQNALQVSQEDGSAPNVEPRPNPNAGQQRDFVEVCQRAGTQFLTNVGVWLLCQSSCFNAPRPPILLPTADSAGSSQAATNDTVTVDDGSGSDDPSADGDQNPGDETPTTTPTPDDSGEQAPTDTSTPDDSGNETPADTSTPDDPEAATDQTPPDQAAIADQAASPTQPGSEQADPSGQSSVNDDTADDETPSDGTNIDQQADLNRAARRVAVH